MPCLSPLTNSPSYVSLPDLITMYITMIIFGRLQCGRMFFGNLGWKKPEKSNSVLFVILIFPHIHFPRAEIYCDDDVVEDGDDDGDNDIHDDSVLPHIQLPRAEIWIARKTMERHCDDDDGDDDDSDDDDDGDNDNDDDGDDDGCKQ